MNFQNTIIKDISLFFTKFHNSKQQIIMGVGGIFFGSLAICLVLGIIAMVQGDS